MYRKFRKLFNDEWQLDALAYVHSMYGEWAVYYVSGTRIINRSFDTANAAIDAYWDLMEEPRTS